MKRFLLIFAFLGCISNCLAQDTAPVPAQLQSPATIFLGTGPGSGGDSAMRLYQATYKALAAAGFTLTPTPATADLVANVSYFYAIESMAGGNKFYNVRLVITDRKTAAILWTIEEGFDSAVRHESRFANGADAAKAAVAALVAMRTSVTAKP